MRFKLLLTSIFVTLLFVNVHAQTNEITLKVNMSGLTVSPNGVHVAGAFQDWNPSSTPMIDEGNGIFSYTFTADEFANLNFKFINGNDWPFQESVPSACGLPDGFGGINRILETGGSDVIYGPYCFGTCDICPPSVEPSIVNVTFRVNMSDLPASDNGVHIAGNFQGWSPSTTALTDVGNGIYEYTAEVAANSELLFKFINGNDWPFQETGFGDCGVPDGFGGFNRVLNVEEEDLVFGPVCFGECADCQVSIPVMVIFQVDMSNEEVAAEGVFVAGSFNNWDATATQLAANGDGSYSAVVFVNANSEISYKFINGTTWEIVPMECGMSDGFGGYNRNLSVANETVITEMVCFNSCSNCVMIPTVSLTFRVDMSNENVSSLGVHVAGSFNNFSPTSTPLIAEGNGIYSATVEVPENLSITYKYINGNDWPGAELVPFECGVNDGFGGYNRSIVTNNSDITLPLVCFSSCEACVLNIADSQSSIGLSIFPNPANEYITISGLQSNSNVAIFDVTGKMVLHNKANTPNFTMNISELNRGIYILRDLSTNASVRLLVK
ncbi:MAG: T9SS type A sorting domain-containing protein [Flavobacteriales bacterium]|jgi:hypothetical protein